MTFNLFTEEIGAKEKARRIWRDMSDPKTLSLRDKLFCVENVGYTRDHGFLVGQSVLKNPLPVTVPQGANARLTMVVGDDIPGNLDRVKSLRLRVGISGNEAPDNVVAMVNGRRLKPEADRPSWLAATVAPDSIKRGDNVIDVMYSKGRSDTVTLDRLELTVRYKGQEESR